MKEKTPQSFDERTYSEWSVVKEHFSLKDANYEYDIRDLIEEVKRMRVAQKKFFASKGKTDSQYYLIEAKRAELSLEALCNRLWSKHKLSKLYSKKGGNANGK